MEGPKIPSWRGTSEMRVAHFTGMHSLKFGGLERWFVELARQSELRGVELVVVFESEPSSAEFIADMNNCGASLRVTPTLGRKRGVAFGAVLSTLRDLQPDAVHAHFHPTNHYALAAARSLGLRQRFLTLHSALPSERAGRTSRIANRILLANATTIFPVSGAVATGFEQEYGAGAKMRVIHLGVPPSLPSASPAVGAPRPLSRKPTPTVLCVAFHDPIKGLDVLLNAISQLVKEGAEFHVLMVGGGTEEQTRGLLNQSRELGVEDCVTWLGRRNDVPSLMAQSDIYCQPSRSEGLPLSVMEAQMAGKPTVASDVGGLAEAVVPGTGILVNPGDPIALAEALKEVLASPEARESMGEAAARHSHRMFNLSRNVSMLLDAYDSSRAEG